MYKIIFSHEQLSVIKQHKFYTYIAVFYYSVLVTLHAHGLTRAFVRYLTEKNTLFSEL